jgi:hypothetical protein
LHFFKTSYSHFVISPSCSLWHCYWYTYVIGLIKNHRTIIREPHWHSCVMFLLLPHYFSHLNTLNFVAKKILRGKNQAGIDLNFVSRDQGLVFIYIIYPVFCIPFTKQFFLLYLYLCEVSNSFETWIGALDTFINSIIT